MGFRLRRSARLGPLRFHFTSSGLSSISIGAPGASLNIPVARRGGLRTTVGLPGTGLSWSLEHSPDPAAPATDQPSDRQAVRWSEDRGGRQNDRKREGRRRQEDPPGSNRGDHPPSVRFAAALPNSRRLRTGQLQELQAQLVALLQQRLFAEAEGGRPLWEDGLVSRLLAQEVPGSRQAGLLALIETPEAMQSYLERSRSQADARRRAQRCVTAFSLATRLAAERGWLR
jgi:hypothetical protein